MKIPKKYRTLISDTCCNYFLCGPQNIYAFSVNDRDAMDCQAKQLYDSGALQSEIRLIHPSALLTADEFEGDGFIQKCRRLLNPKALLCFVALTTTGEWFFRVAPNRNTVIKRIREIIDSGTELAAIWLFGAPPYVYPANKTLFKNSVAKVPAGQVMFYDGVHQVSRAIFENEVNVVASLVSGKPAASFDLEKITLAMKFGTLFTSENNIPVEEFFALAPWELVAKYPGATIIVTGVRRGMGIYALNDPEYLENIISVCALVCGGDASGVSVYIVANTSQDGYDRVQKYCALSEKFALVRLSHPLAETYNGSVGNTLLSAYNAVLQVGEVPSYALEIWHNNGTPRKAKDIAGEDNPLPWRFRIPGATTCEQLFETKYCPSSIISLLDRYGYLVSAFQHKIELAQLGMEMKPLSFKEAYALSLYAVKLLRHTKTSLLPATDNDKSTALALTGMMSCIGLVPRYAVTLQLLSVDDSGCLRCPELTDSVEELSDADVTEDNVINILRAVSLLGASTVDGLVCENTSIFSNIWDRAMRYISLLWKGKDKISLSSLFATELYESALVNAIRL